MGDEACGRRRRQKKRCNGIVAGALLALALALSAGRGAAQTPEQIAFFENQVRPLLAQRCYGCHTAGKSPMGKLSLDTRMGWQQGGEHGPALVPGHPENSLLIKAVGYTDKSLKMPPAGKLPAAEIAALTVWVRMGAPDPRRGAVAPAARTAGMSVEAGRNYWAVQPLKRTAPPTVKETAWCKNPLDRFVLAKLEAKGFSPNPPADRRTLIRRAYFDLIGLPPTPQEVEAFLKDRSPNAYEKVVDKLLASPQYGERWGRHWLDLARFAESHGFEHDYNRPYAYPYRDFVIKALNADMPYDEFVRWQLAGDEIAPDSPLALMATGFLAAGVHSTQITKNQVEKERYDELDDMLATTSISMLGLTVGCARCHNHKYDPIPTQDYYRMLSTFTTTVRSEVDVNLDPQGYQQAKAKFDASHATFVEALHRYEREQLPQHLDRWRREQAKNRPRPVWQILEMQSAVSQGGATLTPQPDGSYLASGKNPAFDTCVFVARTGAKGITALRLEALADSSFVKGGPGRASNGNFALTDFRVMVAPLDGKTPPVAVPLTNPRATFEQAGLPIRAAIDDDPKSAWAIDPQFGKDHAAVFDTAAPIGFEGGTLLTFTLKFENNTGHSIGRPRFAITTAAAPAALDGAAAAERVERLLSELDTKPRPITEEEQTVLLHWYRSLDPEWQQRSRQVQDDLVNAPIPQIQKTLICSEGLPAVRLHTQGDDFFKETYLLKRGDPTQKQEIVTQSFLQVLMRTPQGEKRWQAPPPPGWHTSYRRRAFANWMTDLDAGAGPLLARVLVNRLWQHHIGRGIVGSPSDFGTRGDPPTHPELLEYLASELIRNGWRLKPLHRLLLTSATYRQSAAVTPKMRRADPENRLCGRHPRVRLEAEAIRDSMLAVSGLLDSTMYGPGTLDENQKRRSIYFTVKRSHLIPTMQLFDAPDALQSIGFRAATTVAPQALLLLNNASVRECAMHLAKRAAPQPNTPLHEAIQSAYRLTLSREPSPLERTDTLTFLEQQTASYRAAGHADAADLALADFCQVLLSLNEFIYVD